MKNHLTIGLPNLSKAEGPKIFLSRLKKCFIKNHLAKTTNVLWPFYDIGLFNSIDRSYYGKPYILRLDGIAIDSKETRGRNDHVNIPIFNSIKKAAGLVYQSKFNKELIETFSDIKTQPSCIIHNGVDLEHFSPTGENHRKRLGIPDDHIVLLTSSSWRPHKRLSDIIRIFMILCEQYCHLHLIILGKIQEDIPTHNRIHCSGFISPAQLPGWYRSADIFIFLSWLDTCPNTVVEALASGLPVVCTDQGGTKELIHLTNGGIVAKADQPYDFGLVDLYSPPQPDYAVIIDAILTIVADIKGYKAMIDTRNVDILYVAENYISFCQSFLKNKGNRSEANLVIP